MKLADLDAKFVAEGGTRTGVSFRCPRCRTDRVYVPTADPHGRANWSATGDTIDTLTLSPSVDFTHVRDDGARCNWHGWVREGAVTDT